MSDKLSHPSLFENEVKDFFKAHELEAPDVFFYETTDSTNTRAKLFADEMGTDTRCSAIFFSRAQHAGRGTRGRTFESPAGGGVYISYLLYPDGEISDSLTLTTYAAVSVCRAIKRISDKINPMIKWVNDITVNGKKLSGILTEGRIENGKLKYTIVGIGVNTDPAEHSPEVAALMTSLSDCGIKISPDEFAKILTEEFFLGLPTVGSKSIFKEYVSLSSVIGKEVDITNFDTVRTELAVDIDTDFSLITRDKDGQIHKYTSCDVSVRQKH